MACKEVIAIAEVSLMIGEFSEDNCSQSQLHPSGALTEEGGTASYNQLPSPSQGA